MNPFTLHDTLPRLAAQCDSYLALQRADGAIERADWGLDDPGATCSLVGLCLYTQAVVGGKPEQEAKRLDATERALTYLEGYQRQSGLTDLRDCNFDSSPDAGFILQAMCPAVAAARKHPLREAGGGQPQRGTSDGWGEVLARTEAFLQRMVAGALTGGFHTPNHRWVMSAGLAQAEALFPDLFPQIKPVIERYLAEGFDLNTDGAWIERSAGVYDAICDKSMLILAAHGYIREAALDAACRNLTLNLHLFHADGTIETGLSRRQDFGTRSVPSPLIVPYLLANAYRPNPAFLAAAAFLQERTPTDGYGLTQFLLAHSEPEAAAPALPTSYLQHYPELRVVRLRRDGLSATAFSGTTRLLHLVAGNAELVSVKISQSYFGVGRFVGDDLSVTEEAITLLSEGKLSPYRPGYELPLGRPVPYEQYSALRAERELRRVPDCTSTLEIREIDGGLELHYKALDSLDRVPAQIALDFAPGGIWETEDIALQPQPGQVLFLKRGTGRMRYGRDAIEISPGADGHRMWAMRDAEPAPGLVRVLLTFLTPAEHVLALRCRLG